MIAHPPQLHPTRNATTGRIIFTHSHFRINMTNLFKKRPLTKKSRISGKKLRFFAILYNTLILSQITPTRIPLHFPDFAIRPSWDCNKGLVALRRRPRRLPTGPPSQPREGLIGRRPQFFGRTEGVVMLKNSASVALPNHFSSFSEKPEIQNKRYLATPLLSIF